MELQHPASLVQHLMDVQRPATLAQHPMEVQRPVLLQPVDVDVPVGLVEEEEPDHLSRVPLDRVPDQQRRERVRSP